MPANARPTYYIEVLGKALTVLDVFSRLEKTRLSLQEITQQSKLSKNTVFRILYTLGEHGYVVKHSTEYELVDARLHRKDLASIAGPFMDRLRDQFGETVNLGVLDGAQIRYIDVRESPARFRLAERVGGTDHLHCTALGKAHLAFLPSTQADALLKEAGMPRLTARTITTATSMKAELSRIRKAGYAVDHEESMLGAYCVGVPILGDDRVPIAALSVSGPTVRFNESALPHASRALLDAAAEIRGKMGTRLMYTSNELANLAPLRLERIDAYRVRIPMLEPFRISSGEVADKDATLVRLSEADAFGWGESSAMGGGFYSSETPDSCQQELVERVLPQLVGHEFASLAQLEEQLGHLSSSRFVRVAVEAAACELLARKRGVSLQSLFGIERRPIPSGLAIGLYNSVDELWQAIERYRPRDYQRLKIKIKRGQDVALVARVRLLLDHFPLFVDANADYGLDSLKVFQKLDRYGLMMFEQPFAKDDLEGSAELQRSVDTPVCLDESIESVADVRRAIALGSCQIVNIKLQRVGGFLEAIRIAEECVAHGIGLWMGTMPELGIGSAQALVLGADPAFTLPTDVEPSKRWYIDDVLNEPLSLMCGQLNVPKGPGLGFTVDLEKIREYQIASWRFEP